MIHHIFDSYKAWLPDDTWFVKLTVLDLESVIELFLRDLIKMKQLYLFYLFCNKELLIIVQPKWLWDHILKLFDNLELRHKSSLFQTGFELSSSIHLLRILFKVIFINLFKGQLQSDLKHPNLHLFHLMSLSIDAWPLVLD